MAFDGIVIANLTHELKTILVGGRMSKIAMPNSDELNLTIKNNAKTYHLLISASASLPLMYLTDVKKPSPLKAPTFCMLLRKYINTARIGDIYQLGLERIICIEMEHMNELGDLSKKRLYIELMGKHSNIIFTDEKDIIIDSIKRISAQISSLREVLPGKAYFLPEELKKADFRESTLENFIIRMKEGKYPLAKSIYMYYAGISPLIAEELCTRSGLSSQSDISLLSDLEKTHLYYTIQRMMEEIKSADFKPNIIYKKDEPIEFSSFLLQIYPIKGEYFVKFYDSISHLLYDYYSQKDHLVRIRSKSAELRKIVSNAYERAVKKYDLQEKQMKDTAKKDKYKIYGDLIHTYGYKLVGGEKQFTCENYYDNNKEVMIPLDIHLSAMENAKRYYDKYTKQKRTFEALTEEIKKTEFDMQLLDSILMSLDMATTEEDLVQIKKELMDCGYIRKSFGKQKAVAVTSGILHYISSDGFHIYVGKNNIQNDYLTFKLATGNDWWFHAKGIPGSHVIVKSENKELPDRTFEEAGSLAAYYSKGRFAPKVEIDYIQRKNLRKVPNGALGFVIYHTNWSMIVKPEITIQEVL